MKTGHPVLLALALFSASLLLAQSLEQHQNELVAKASLCEARYRSDGFTSAVAFVVSCLNPAFEEFYTAMQAPPYMYESVKTQSLLMGAKVDANEVNIDTAIRNIAAVASVTFDSLQAQTSPPQAANSNSVDRQKVLSACTRTATIAQDSVKTQYDNQWLAYIQNNPQPLGLNANQQAMMVLNGQLGTPGVIGMQIQNQEAQRVWLQQLYQAQTLHNQQRDNAMTSTYTSTFELCKIQNGME